MPTDGATSQQSLLRNVIIEQSDRGVYLSVPYPLHAEIIQEKEKTDLSLEVQQEEGEIAEKSESMKKKTRRSKTGESPRSYMRRKRADQKRTLQEAEIIEEKKQRDGFIPNKEEENILKEAIKIRDYRIKDAERRRNKKYALRERNSSLQKVEKIKSKELRANQPQCNHEKSDKTASNTTKDTPFPQPSGTHQNTFFDLCNSVIDKPLDFKVQSYWPVNQKKIPCPHHAPPSFHNKE
ncbi:MAG TPA: hypothetical protein DCE71_03680, partial [Parachlamydiales bacterium]|nr:hypothetical protein [Parachlamydiales bacterium]